ncbi:PREDICTED: probable myosin-binding protein 5 [Lupinus angustifolius]|uniref:probable myosin-binding protein 5 n=1 Tax=Lupinus angustifolius TaxID=3871 RepID=UPI00092F4B4E|nr:PREDICTED: probable myosin-binding protein 5 [Lupinus angustifolius]
MQNLGHFCLWFVFGLYKKFLHFSLTFMDFASTFKFLTHPTEVGCGFVLLGGYSPILGLLFIFLFSYKILRSRSSAHDLLEFRFGLEGSKFETLGNETLKSIYGVKKKGLDEGMEEKEKDENIEDEVLDVMMLRKLVKIERQRYHAACAEIEKERVAASSAAAETMAMILRLQSEKSSIGIQANQFRRMAEQKQDYDQEVIEELRWVIMQHESHKSLLEDQLGIYTEKLSEYMSDDEIDQLEGVDACRGFLNFSVECDTIDASLETDLQTL